MACDNSCLARIICALLVAAVPYFFNLATADRHSSGAPAFTESDQRPYLVDPPADLTRQRPRASAPPPLCMTLPDGSDFCCRSRRPRLRWRIVQTPYGPEYVWREYCA